MSMTPKEKSQEWSRITKNTAVTPSRENRILGAKARKKAGFTGNSELDRELIASHVDEFIASGGKIDVLHCDMTANPKAQTFHHMGLEHS